MLIFIRVWHYINFLFKSKVTYFVVVQLILTAASAWEVDLSRRRQERQQKEMVVPLVKTESESVFENVLSSSDPTEDLVIINTGRGFVPATVRVRADRRYTVHLVNINEEEKNVSFISDAFSQHHSTYFGQERAFVLEPKREGIYSFQCPETGAQGRIVVYGGQGAVQLRQPASAAR